jgi:signal transduction histidine kinase
VRDQRLQAIHRISKLLAGFDDVRRIFGKALDFVAKALSLDSAMLIESEEGASHTTVWHRAGKKSSPHSATVKVPLRVAHRPLLGELRVEGERLDKNDLLFIKTVGNQLAIALERERAETHGPTQKILSMVSHDLRNPIGTILMGSDLLLSQGAAPESVARLTRAARRMLRLIEDLLDFASMEAGAFAVKRAPQNPGSIVLEAKTSFEPTALEKGLRLTSHIDPNLPKISCDRDRLLRVFFQLVGNATKVTARGGEIALRAEARAQDVLFAVKDGGPGISAQDATHLFEPYWRGDEAHESGIGLGFAIARGIVQAHGGLMWVESELGGGSTFYFTIPNDFAPTRTVLA